MEMKNELCIVISSISNRKRQWSHSFIESLNASNRPQVLRVLLQTFNRHIVDISKSGLDQFVRATLKLLERGYNNQSGLQRICLDTPVQLELLYGAYVCMYNGFQVRDSFQFSPMIRFDC